MGDTRTLPIIWTTLGWWTLNQDGTWTVTDDLEVHKNKNKSTDEKAVLKSCSRYMYFSADCDKKSNLPSNHLVISQTDKTTSDYYWDTWREQSRIHFTVTAVKKACSCHRGKTNPRATPGGEKWHQTTSAKVNSPHLSLLSLYILTSLSIPPRVTVPSSWDVSRGRRKRHEEREAKTTGI